MICVGVINNLKRLSCVIVVNFLIFILKEVFGGSLLKFCLIKELLRCREIVIIDSQFKSDVIK